MTAVLLVFAVAFNLYHLYPEVTIRVPPLNDAVMHLLALKRAVAALAAGQDPTDPWLAQMVMGYPLFHYYQHLPHVLLAATFTLLSAGLRSGLPLADLYAWTNYLLLSLFPLSIYWSMRRFGFEPLTAALTGLAAPLVSTDGLFGLDFNSYVWSGYGLYTQLWGMLLLPPALAQGYVALRVGRGYFRATLLLAATTLSHLAFGYIAIGSLILLVLVTTWGRDLLRRGRRLALLLGLTGLVTSYFLVPLMLDSDYFNHSVWDPPRKFDSYGHEWVLGSLMRGELFDHGHFPSLTILAAVGLVVCLRRWRDEHYRVPMALSVLWLLLYFGRPTWGALLDLLPMSRDMYFHRLIAGVHLGGIYLIGIGLALPWSWALARKDARYLLAAVAVTALLLSPVYRERAEYLGYNASWRAQSRDAFEAEKQDVIALVDWLRAAPPGRVYAGLGGGWGREYRIGAVPMYAVLTNAELDSLGYVYHPFSVNGDVQVLFDERRSEQYELFNVRYVVAPSDHAFPDFVRPVAAFGRHRVYEVATGGYFGLVGSGLVLAGDKGELYAAASRWLAGDGPRAGEHPRVELGRRADYRERFPLAGAEALLGRTSGGAARGRVVAERVEGNGYWAAVEVERESVLMLRETYHPGWRAEVDGAAAGTVMLLPSYVGVPLGPGRHLVRLEYRSTAWRGYLMALGLLALVITGLVERCMALLRWTSSSARRSVPSLPTRSMALFASYKPSLRMGEWLRAQLPFLGGLVLMTLLTGWPLLRLKLMSGHDHLEYLPRNVEFYQALLGGQLFPRWAPDLSGGYGEPFFSFNPPLIYYLSTFFHVLGFSFVAAENLACLALLLLAGLGMFLLAGAFFGRRGGLVSATAYLFAPYLLSRLYVSHALADFSAFAFLPLAFWGLYRFAEGGCYRFLLVGALALALLLLSSNPVALITLPFLVFALGWLAWFGRSLGALLRGIWCLALGLGLSAMFWLPAMTERDLVQTHRLLESFLNYNNHFAYLHQLLYSPWGYGVSLPGPGDGMSFAIGPVHLALPAAALLLLPRIRDVSGRASLVVVFTLILIMVGAFFSVYESALVWDRLRLLQYLEYPWRFHALVALGTAVLCGFPFVLLTTNQARLANGMMVALIGAVLVFNFSHVGPERFTEVTDGDFRPEIIASRYIAVTTAREYEPIWVRERPRAPPAEALTVLSGRASVALLRQTPADREFRVVAAEEARLRINTFYFPGWTLLVDGAERAIDRSNPQGLMELSIGPGTHSVRITFGDTMARLWAMRLSLLALLLLLATPWLTTWLGMIPSARIPGLAEHRREALATWSRRTLVRPPAWAALGRVLGWRPAGAIRFARPGPVTPRLAGIGRFLGALVTSQPVPRRTGARVDDHRLVLARSRLILAAGIVLFALCTSYMNWVKYESLRSTWPLDLGFFHNAAFNIAHGRSITYFSVSAWFDRQEHEGPSVYRSPHFSPMQSLLLPQLYRVFPTIQTLMLLQSAILALGALPLFWIGSQRTGQPKLSLVLALSYLLHPAILHLAFNDYRPVVLGIPLALFALWFHAMRRPVGFVVASLLMLASQAEYLFLLAFFGLINWRTDCSKGRDLRWMIAPVLMAVLWAGLTDAYFLYAYGRSWPVLALAAQSVPLTGRLLDFGDRLSIFLRIGLLPAGMALIVPESFAVAVPFVVIANRVGWPDFPHHNLQHLSPALAVILWAFAAGVIWLRRRVLRGDRPGAWFQQLLLAAALISFAQFGWSAARAYLIGGFPRYEEISRINDSLPADATLVVPTDLAARFSNHTRVLTTDALPLGQRFRLLDSDKRARFERLISICDLVATGTGEEWIDDLVMRSGRYEPARSIGRFRVFVARRNATRPDNPDAFLQGILGWDQFSETERRWIADTRREMMDTFDGHVASP